jgi:hypothetical protein
MAASLNDHSALWFWWRLLVWLWRLITRQLA